MKNKTTANISNHFTTTQKPLNTQFKKNLAFKLKAFADLYLILSFR